MVIIWFYYFYRCKKYAKLILKIIYESKKENKKHVDNILAKAKTADVIYLAKDLGREGELTM